MVRETLAESGLFVEGTEVFTTGKAVNAYYGFNVSKTQREPIDQLQAFFAAKRIQERNLNQFGRSGEFYPFIAGAFEIFNATSVKEMYRLLETNRKKDERKKSLFQRIMDRYGVPGKIYTTKDLWGEKKYWGIFEQLLEENAFSEEELTRDTLTFYGTTHRLAKVIKVAEIPPEVVDVAPQLRTRIAQWPAALLYTPAQVAEAVFFSRSHGVNLKLGPVKEMLYDKHVMAFIDVAHLRQPVDLTSKRLKPCPVSPYTHTHRSWGQERRIFFDDTADTIRERLRGFEPEEYAFALEPLAGEILNPFLELLVYVVEAARCLNQGPVVLLDTELATGGDVLDRYRQGSYTISQLVNQIASLVETLVIKPLLPVTAGPD